MMEKLVLRYNRSGHDKLIGPSNRWQLAMRSVHSERTVRTHCFAGSTGAGPEIREVPDSYSWLYSPHCFAKYLSSPTHAR